MNPSPSYIKKLNYSSPLSYYEDDGFNKLASINKSGNISSTTINLGSGRVEMNEGNGVYSLVTSTIQTDGVVRLPAGLFPDSYRYPASFDYNTPYGIVTLNYDSITSTWISYVNGYNLMISTPADGNGIYYGFGSSFYEASAEWSANDPASIVAANDLLDIGGLPENVFPSSWSPVIEQAEDNIYFGGQPIRVVQIDNKWYVRTTTQDQGTYQEFFFKGLKFKAKLIGTNWYLIV
jgi:hypothetical protein